MLHSTSSDSKHFSPALWTVKQKDCSLQCTDDAAGGTGDDVALPNAQDAERDSGAGMFHRTLDVLKARPWRSSRPGLQQACRSDDGANDISGTDQTEEDPTVHSISQQQQQPSQQRASASAPAQAQQQQQPQPQPQPQPQHQQQHHHHHHHQQQAALTLAQFQELMQDIIRAQWQAQAHQGGFIPLCPYPGCGHQAPLRTDFRKHMWTVHGHVDYREIGKTEHQRPAGHFEHYHCWKCARSESQRRQLIDHMRRAHWVFYYEQN